jgi:hypothetical protein
MLLHHDQQNICNHGNIIPRQADVCKCCIHVDGGEWRVHRSCDGVSCALCYPPAICPPRSTCTMSYHSSCSTAMRRANRVHLLSAMQQTTASSSNEHQTRSRSHASNVPSTSPIDCALDWINRLCCMTCWRILGIRSWLIRELDRAYHLSPHCTVGKTCASR